MTDWTVQSMGKDPQVLSRRLADYVRPRATAKELSKLIGCDQRTAENIRQGHWPIARHWFGLVMAFGRDVTDAVFHPDEAAERFEREIRDLERQLAERRAAHEQAAKAAREHRARTGKARKAHVVAVQNRTSATLEREPAP